MVMLFMILIYGKYGIIANIALISFGLITIAIYRLVPITLTLPGIAGFLLGMQNNFDFLFWIGMGITIYWFAYFFVHDIFIHQRIKFLWNS